jgi:hypothetical protein
LIEVATDIVAMSPHMNVPGTAAPVLLHKLQARTRGLQPLQTKKMPIATRSLPKARWVEPRVSIDVEFRGKTGDGLLRHPSYHGVREDLMEPPAPRVSRASGRRGRPGLSARRA